MGQYAASARIYPIMLIALVLLLLTTLSTERASAKAHEFAPVKKTRGMVAFRPHGLDSAAVKRAKLKFRVGGGWTRRRVPTGKVQRAVRSGSEVKLPRPARSRRGVLRIQVRGVHRNEHAPKPGEPCGLTLSAGGAPAACWRPYSDGSPFNRALPPNPPLAGNSSAIVSRWASQPDSNMPGFTAGDADTSNDYDHPVYFSSGSDPLYTIACLRWTADCEVDGLQVRIPSGARAAMGSDGHLTVIDRESGWEYDFWETEAVPRGGGVLSVGHGGRTMIDGDGLGSNATAAHFGGAAGIIRPEELAAGEINHALFLVVECTNDTSVPPAADGSGRSCSSIGKSNSNAPAMGQHLYLGMSDAEIEGLNVADWQKTILRAMATYGLFVGDTGGGSLKTMSGSSYTSFGRDDPWTTLGGNLGVPSWRSSRDGEHRYMFDLENAVDWKSKLRVVDPCVAAGTC